MSLPADADATVAMISNVGTNSVPGAARRYLRDESLDPLDRGLHVLLAEDAELRRAGMPVHRGVVLAQREIAAGRELDVVADDVERVGDLVEGPADRDDRMCRMLGEVAGGLGTGAGVGVRQLEHLGAGDPRGRDGDGVGLCGPGQHDGLGGAGGRRIGGGLRARDRGGDAGVVEADRPGAGDLAGLAEGQDGGRLEAVQLGRRVRVVDEGRDAQLGRRDDREPVRRGIVRAGQHRDRRACEQSP